MSLNRDIIDALALDFEQSAGLKDHSLVKYRRPRIILPEDCPMLVVWLDNKIPTPRTTERFDGTITVGVSWHEEAVEEAETLESDPDIALALIESLEKLEARVRVLAAGDLKLEDGSVVMPVWQVLSGESRYFRTPLEEGLTEGYSLAVICYATE